MDIQLKSLFDSSDFSDFLFNNLTEAILLLDESFAVQKTNATFRSLFDRSETEVMEALCGNAIGCEFAIDQKVQCGSSTECCKCHLRKQLTYSLESTVSSAYAQTANAYISRIFYINNEPTTKHFRIQTRPVIYDGKKLILVVINDITEIEEQKQKIAEMAHTDFLTGLYNRRYFFDIAEKLFFNAQRGTISIAVAMLDLDNFKRINDRHGHACGDFILTSVSDILKNNARRADVLCRFGGEEFCLLVHCANQCDAYTVVDKMRLFIETNAFIYENMRIPVTISAGITCVMEDSLEKMILKADEMLYLAKKNGRNRVEECTGK